MNEMSMEEGRRGFSALVNRARHAGQSTVITHWGKPVAMVAPLARLTEADRRAIDRARELAALRNDTIRQHTGEDDLIRAHLVAFARAQWQIGDLLAIIGRLDGQDAAQATEADHG